MLGKSHYRLGMLYYLLFTTIPILAMIPFLHTKSEITLAGIITAGFGALLPDADSQHSIINQINPVTGLANRAIGKIEELLITLVKLLFTFGAGVFIIYYSNNIIGQISQMAVLPQIAENAKQITYTTAALLIIAGLLGEPMIRRIPVIGSVYEGFTNSIRNLSNFLKRCLMFFVYAGFGTGLLFYNFKSSRDIMIYLIGGLFIAIAIFPHRSFLHAPEGLILFTIAFSYIANKIGQPYLTSAFFAGYASHLYLADIFTQEGVPLSSLPMMMKKTHLHDMLRHLKGYSIVFKVLNRRLVIPFISTGTESGNRFELIYTLTLTIMVGIQLLTWGHALALI